MPPKRSLKPQHRTCQHPKLTFEISPAAVASGCIKHTPQQLFTATTGKRKRRSAKIIRCTDFPGPLGIPDDSLLDDPKYPPQSFRTWLNEPARNALTARRSILYVAGPPEVAKELGYMSELWSGPVVEANGKEHVTKAPTVDEIIVYLQAFYHGVEVRRLPSQLSWVPWETRSREQSPRAKNLARLPGHVGLRTGNGTIRIRLRQASSQEEDRLSRNLFRYQVNQLDLLSVAEAVLPEDGYSILLLVNHDLYEDEDDDFCCGRAFGGSRIAAVSTARYDPVLDGLQGVDKEHAWPASHCADFVNQAHEPRSKSRTSRRCGATKEAQLNHGGLHAAVKIVRETSLLKFDARTTYLLRVCRTASHEIGHCFGMDHCMYYACAMQGTCSLPEDSRQPPYLCPVCEAKVEHAVANGRVEGIDDWKKARHEAILRFCDDKGGEFQPLGAWTRSILRAEQKD